jgi:branched-chain amino acid transport system permease protein
MIDPLITQSVIFGSLIAMMCVGLTVTYLTTKVPNFAAGDFVITGTYASATAFIIGRIESPYYAIPVGFLFGAIAAVVMYVAILRPLIRKGSSLVMLMVATLAVNIIFSGIDLLFIERVESVYGRILGDRGYNFYTLYSLGDFRFFGEPGLLIVAPVSLAGMAVAIYMLLNKTRFGVAMRAAIENANLAKILGINVERVYLVSWFIAGGLAGVAGGFFAIAFTTQQGESSALIVSIFAGSVLGGLGSIYGAIIGGAIIGLGQVYITGALVLYVSKVVNVATGSAINNFQLGIPLGIMIITLLFAPQGLTGIRWSGLFRKRRPVS